MHTLNNNDKKNYLFYCCIGKQSVTFKNETMHAVLVSYSNQWEVLAFETENLYQLSIKCRGLKFELDL
jgi:ureidoglycolate hydrolase